MVRTKHLVYFLCAAGTLVLVVLFFMSNKGTADTSSVHSYEQNSFVEGVSEYVVIRQPNKDTVTARDTLLSKFENYTAAEVAEIEEELLLEPEEDAVDILPQQGFVEYASDGFPVYAQYEEGGEITNADLDMCQGHAHVVMVEDVLTETYHYHITDTIPDTVGCFTLKEELEVPDTATTTTQIATSTAATTTESVSLPASTSPSAL